MQKGILLYIGGFALPDKNAAAHRVVNNAKILKQIGYEVIFVDINADETADLVNTKHSTYGFTTYSLPGFLNASRNMAAVKELYAIYPNILGLVVYNPHFTTLLKLKSFCCKKRIKLICDCTEWYGYRFSINPVRMAKWLDSNITMRYANKKADGLILISTYLANYYSGHPHICVIPPLVDLQEEKWNSPAAVQQDERIVFVCAGDMGPNKDNIGLFIDVLFQLRNAGNFLFRIVGITKQAFLAAYPNYREKLSALENSVVFEGRLPHREALKMVQQADVSVIIREKSRKNQAGFPTKFVESVSSGVNILANDFSDIRQYFPATGSCILLEEITQQTLRKALEDLLTDPQLKSTRPEKGDAEKFDYRCWIDEMAKFMESL